MTSQIEHDRQQHEAEILPKSWTGGLVHRGLGYVKDTTPPSPITRFPTVIEGNQVYLPSHPHLGAGLLTKVWMIVERRCPDTGTATLVSFNGMICFGRAWLVANLMMVQPWNPGATK